MLYQAVVESCWKIFTEKGYVRLQRCQLGDTQPKQGQQPSSHLQQQSHNRHPLNCLHSPVFSSCFVRVQYLTSFASNLQNWVVAVTGYIGHISQPDRLSTLDRLLHT